MGADVTDVTNVSTAKEVMYSVMKSYATTRINETKDEIANKKPGMNEKVSLEDTFEMKVTKHPEDSKYP